MQFPKTLTSVISVVALLACGAMPPTDNAEKLNLKASEAALTAREIDHVFTGNTLTLKRPGSWLHIYFSPSTLWNGKVCRSDICPLINGRWWIEESPDGMDFFCMTARPNLSEARASLCYEVRYPGGMNIVIQLTKKNGLSVEGESERTLIWEKGNTLSSWAPGS